MPDQPQSSGGIGGTLKAKLGPLPTWGWLALVTVALLGYWLWTQHQASASGTSTSGGATPASVGQPGVVVINQDEGGEEEGTTPPITPEKKKDKDKSSRQITVTKAETLGQLAKQRHWSSATLKAVEQENVTQGGGHWTASTRLKKGQEVIRPLRS